MIRRFLLPILAALASPAEGSTGAGPRSIYPINQRFMAVADSSVDAILIVDANAGGSIVGHFVLHSRNVDSDHSKWLNPISISSCEDCKHLYLTSNNMSYKMALVRPLKDMADNYNFDDFKKSTIKFFWPSGWGQNPNDRQLKGVSIARDGSSAYVAHAEAVYSFDGMNPDDSDPKARKVITTEDAGINGELINNIHHTHSLKNLILTSDHYTSFVNILDDTDENPLDRDRVVAYQLPLDYHCNYLYDGVKMRFFDTAIVAGYYAFALGQATESEETDHPGVAIYRLTWDDDDEQWHSCVQIAGSGLEEAQWVDGMGYDARFSATAHQISVMPTDDYYLLLIGDTDNRAVRLVDVTTPTITDYVTEAAGVSSIAYNEDLYQVLYNKEKPWSALTPESVSKNDGKSYFHSGEDSVYSMNFDEAQDECGRIGVGRVCTLPELRARFARGQYPSIDGDDESWTTVWTAQKCEGCHLQGPGKCDVGSSDNWGQEYKMIANFSPAEGMQTQCVHTDTAWEAMSMCCGLGGPAVLGAKATTSASEQAKKNASISAGVIVPVLIIAMVAYALYMRKRQKPAWWPSFLRSDRREDTGHAPHREVDLRGRDYI